MPKYVWQHAINSICNIARKKNDMKKYEVTLSLYGQLLTSRKTGGMVSVNVFYRCVQGHVIFPNENMLQS